MADTLDLTGATGASGPIGLPGGFVVGATGVPGPPGLMGEPGPTGSQGLPGDSIAGPTGVPGPMGLQGPVGPQGVAGPQGLPGFAGPPGLEGITGPTGPRGATGQQGVQGLVGATGEPGATGAPGLPGTPGIIGSIGPPGPIGPQGSGATGATGTIGPTGPFGIQGFTGPTGPAGTPGTPGPTGVPGPSGPQGSTGPMGPQGPLGGPSGPVGPQGPTGPQGIQGPAGPSGPQGIGGQVGATGVVGPPGGPSGPTGPQGIQGPTGPQGLQGPTGPSGGPTGPTGVAGPAGPSGTPGATGPAPTPPAGPLDTFDPATANGLANGGISSDHLTINANASSSPSYLNARSIAHHDLTSGSYYLEFIVNDYAPANWESSVVGVGTTMPVPPGAYTGGHADSIGMFSDGNVYSNNTTVATIPGISFTLGCVIGIAISNGKIWFRQDSGNWNGSPTANPTTGAEGIAVPSGAQYFMATIAYSGTAGTTSSITVKAAPPFAHAAPSGFLAWTPPGTFIGATGPQGPTGPAGTGGGSSNEFDTRALAIAASIPTGVHYITTSGYYSVEDGGGATYKVSSYTPITYATLLTEPGPSGYTGYFYFVIDASTSTLNTIISGGGGTNKVWVCSNGTNWIISRSPGCIQTADGKIWEYVPETRGVNCKSFGAVSDANTSTVWTTEARITFTAKPTSGSTITLNGTVVTWGNGTGGTVNIGTTRTTAVQNLQTFLNASADAQISKNTYNLIGDSSVSVYSGVTAVSKTVWSSYTVSQNDPAGNVSMVNAPRGAITNTGTDSTAFIQDALDFAMRKVIPVVFLPNGTYLTSDTLHVGWPGGFYTVLFEGDIQAFGTGSSSPGTCIIFIGTDRQCIDLAGGRNSGIRQIKLMNPVHSHWIWNNIWTKNGSGFDEPLNFSLPYFITGNASLWVDPSQPQALSRNAPIAGITIDAFAGPQPPDLYDIVKDNTKFEHGAVVYWDTSVSKATGSPFLSVSPFTSWQSVGICTLDTDIETPTVRVKASGSYSALIAIVGSVVATINNKYPQPVWPAWTGITGYYNQNYYSSEMKFTYMNFDGWPVAIAGGANTDSQGDFCVVKYCDFPTCCICISLNHSQSRNVDVSNCNPNFVHTCLDNTRFGSGNGTWDGPISNISGGNSYQYFDLGGAGFELASFYGEGDCRRLGRFQGNSGLKLTKWNVSFYGSQLGATSSLIDTKACSNEVVLERNTFGSMWGIQNITSGQASRTTLGPGNWFFCGASFPNSTVAGYQAADYGGGFIINGMCDNPSMGNRVKGQQNITIRYPTTANPTSWSDVESKTKDNYILMYREGLKSFFDMNLREWRIRQTTPPNADFASSGLARSGGSVFSGFSRDTIDPSKINVTVNFASANANAQQYDFKVGDMLVDHDTGTILVVTVISGSAVTMVQQNNYTNWNGVWKDVSVNYYGRPISPISTTEGVFRIIRTGVKFSQAVYFGDFVAGSSTVTNVNSGPDIDGTGASLQTYLDVGTLLFSPGLYAFNEPVKGENPVGLSTYVGTRTNGTGPAGGTITLTGRDLATPKTAISTGRYPITPLGLEYVAPSLQDDRTPVTYANLPVSPPLGAVRIITNANANTFGANVTGAGSFTVKAWWNGTNWTVTAA